MSSLFDLTGRNMIVTGGNGGIGLGMAQALAEAGANVAIWGTNPDKNDTALGSLEGSGSHLALVCDVGNESAVEKAFEETTSKLGNIHGCFANAGVGGSGKTIDRTSYEDWRRVQQINLDGVFFTFRAASKNMMDHGEGGCLVVTSSLSAIEGAPRSLSYASTKGAVISMIKGLAVGLARYDVRAHAVLPGWIETAMTANAVGNEKFEQNVIRRVPMRRWGQPEDFGGIAVYLASDASRYHTGDSFVIDGGYALF